MLAVTSVVGMLIRTSRSLNSLASSSSLSCPTCHWLSSHPQSPNKDEARAELSTGQDKRNLVAIDEVRNDEAWVAAVLDRGKRCRACYNLDPRGHVQSRVFRLRVGKVLKLVSVLEVQHFQLFVDWTRTAGKTCNYCDTLDRAAFAALKTGGWLQDRSLRFLTK